MSALYIDCLSRPNNSLSVVGRGIAMHSTGGGDSSISYHYCGNPGHRQKNCVAGTATQRKGQISTRLVRHRSGAGKEGKEERASRCGARSTSLPLTTTRHTARKNSKWATMGAPIAPTSSRTTSLPSLQAILLRGVISRSKVYRSLQ